MNCFRDGANYLAVGDILGNVIILKTTPREFFFKFFDRVLEGSSRFLHVLSINLSPKSTHIVISRCDGTIVVFKEFVEVLRMSSVLDNLQLISRAKKMPKKTSKSPPKIPMYLEKKAAIESDATSTLKQSETQEDEADGNLEDSKTSQIEGQIKLFQLKAEMVVRPLSAAPIQCCSISDAGM